MTSKRIKRLEDEIANLGPEADAPTVVTYTDGETNTLPSHREMLGFALEQEKEFESLMDSDFGKKLMEGWGS